MTQTQGYRVFGWNPSPWGANEAPDNMTQKLGQLVMFDENPYALPNPSGTMRTPKKIAWPALPPSGEELNGWQKMIQRDKKDAIDAPWLFDNSDRTIGKAIRIPYYYEVGAGGDLNLEYLLIGYRETNTAATGHAQWLTWPTNGQSDMSTLGELILRLAPGSISTFKQVPDWFVPPSLARDPARQRWEFRSTLHKVHQSFRVKFAAPNTIVNDGAMVIWQIFVGYEGGAGY